MAKLGTSEWIEVFASAARTATPTAVKVDLRGANGETPKGVLVGISVTAIAATPGLTVNVDLVGPTGVAASAAILASAALSATGQTFLTIYPGTLAAANVRADGAVTPTLNIRPVHADADSITYSISVLPLD